VCLCSDGTCVQADGTSWSMILNGTINSTSSSQSDVTDSVSVMSLHSAASSLPVTHGTVASPSSHVDRLRTKSPQTTTSNDFMTSVLSCVVAGLTLASRMSRVATNPENLEYSGISVNMENSGNSQGILCNLREKLPGMTNKVFWFFVQIFGQNAVASCYIAGVDVE